ERTSSGSKSEHRLNIPDRSVRAGLALEIDRQETDTPAAKLPLIEASDLGNGDRIEARAVCDYLLRRDRTLLRTLDQAGRAVKTVNPNAVAETFAEQAGGLTLPGLDADWRTFWTGTSPALRAIRQGQTPLEAISKE